MEPLTEAIRNFEIKDHKSELSHVITILQLIYEKNNSLSDALNKRADLMDKNTIATLDDVKKNSRNIEYLLKVAGETAKQAHISFSDNLNLLEKIRKSIDDFFQAFKFYAEKIMNKLEKLTGVKATIISIGIVAIGIGFLVNLGASWTYEKIKGPKRNALMEIYKTCDFTFYKGTTTLEPTPRNSAVKNDISQLLSAFQLNKAYLISIVGFATNEQIIKNSNDFADNSSLARGRAEYLKHYIDNLPEASRNKQRISVGYSIGYKTNSDRTACAYVYELQE